MLISNFIDLFLRKEAHKQHNSNYRQISSYETSEVDKMLKSGASQNVINWLKEQYETERIAQEQFMDALPNVIYVIDLEYLRRKFTLTEEPAGTTRNFSYPTAFYGAIFGDIAGSAYEGMYNMAYRSSLTYDNCIIENSRPTDDTILTCATAIGDKELTVENREYQMRDFCMGSTFPYSNGNPFTRAYADCVEIHYENPSFGVRFYDWAVGKDHRPYGSLGNGSAARVSPLIEKYESLNDLILHVIASAAATHNHYEGVKGAVVTAVAGWMAYHGYDKEQIFQYMKNHYNGEDNSVSVFSRITEFTMDELKVKDGPTVCSFSVPAAAICFHEADSFKEVINNALSFDGDTDTIGAIAGTIAGAYYGVPEGARKLVKERNIGEMFWKAEEAIKKV